MKKVWIMVGFMTVFVVFFGWLPRDRSWDAATGWNRIGESGRPPGGVSDLLFDKGAGGAKVHWLGHSGFLIRWSGVTLLLDPNLQERVTFSARYIAPPLQVYTNTIDAACISHAHFDHMSPATLGRFAHIGQVIVPDGSQTYLDDALPGETVRHGLEIGESVGVGPLTITAVAARHNGCRYHPWRSRYKAAGYVVSDGTNTLYYSGDTGYQPEANDVIRRTYHPDTAILPIGCYAPRFPFRIHHMDPREAALAARALGVSRFIPCHFGTYRLTLDEPSRALRRFAGVAVMMNLNWSMPEYYE